MSCTAFCLLQIPPVGRLTAGMLRYSSKNARDVQNSSLSPHPLDVFSLMFTDNWMIRVDKNKNEATIVMDLPSKKKAEMGQTNVSFRKGTCSALS